MRLIASLDRRSRGRAPRGPRPARAAPPRTPPRAAAPGTPTRAAASPPNSSTSNPSRSRSAACASSACRAARRQLDQQRLEQPLALEPAAGQPLGDALEQDALVRHVLVDDGDALFVHRDDERVAELAERHHAAGSAAVARPRWPADSVRRRRPKRRRSAPRAASAPRRALADRVGPAGARCPAARERRADSRPAAAASTAAARSSGAATRGRSSGAGPRPSASPSARRTTWWMYDWSRNRTSAFVGWTLTSTASRGISMNRCTSGLRSLIDADAVGVDDRVRDGPVLHDAAVDEHVLRPARRPLLGQRRDVARAPSRRRCSRRTSMRSARSP